MAADAPDRSASGPTVEWRTVAVAVAVHGLWLAVLALHGATPWPVTILALGLIAAWHGSLQHETIHGHPFRSQRLNALLASLPMSLHLPYLVYRRYHWDHHDCPELTDPTEDSESFYVTAEQWESMGRLGRVFVLAHHTLLGRLLLGPPRYIAGVLVHQAREIRLGDRELARWWSAHVVAAAALVAFVVVVMGVPWWQYVLGATYLGNSLTLMRSYCEHRWVEGATRSAVVRSGRFFSLLYLYNNLHHVHHADPGVPWYRLSAHADATGGYDEAAAGAGLYRGYFELARRFGVRPFDHPVHPRERAGILT